MAATLLRCNRKTVTASGEEVITERAFVSTDKTGAQLNPGVQNASYNDTLVGATEDTSINLNDVVPFSMGVPTPTTSTASAPAASAPAAPTP